MMSGYSTFTHEVTARHSPDAAFFSVCALPGVQTWVVLELQVFRTILVPLAVASPAVSMHRPLSSMLPPEVRVATWPEVPSQVDISTAVPGVVLLPVSVRQPGCSEDGIAAE